MRLSSTLGGLSSLELLKRTWLQFWQDRILDQSAKLSFYFLLSLFPLFLFLVALLGIIFRFQSDPVLLETLHRYLSAVVPSSATGLIDKTLGEVIAGSGGAKLSFALFFTLLAASKGMLALIEGLNIAYNARETRSWIRKNILALKLTLVTSIMVACALVLLIFGELAVDLLVRQVGAPRIIMVSWHGLQFFLVFALLLAAFDMVYYYGPNVSRRKWHWFMPGTLIAIGIWLAASLGFKAYIHFFGNYTVTYGSIGAVIILLLWLYLSGIAILLGAEVNSEIERHAQKAPPKT